MSKMVIAVDAMGGDNAPGAMVRGALLALEQAPDMRVLLFGRQSEIEPLLQGAPDVLTRVEVVHAEDVIRMDEPPAMAIRKKIHSSMVQAMLALKEGRAQAMVSAGSTGALLTGGMLRVGRIVGVDRPALAPVLPGSQKPFLLIDSGANVDCQPEYLERFGLMGSVYMKCVLGVHDPVVQLVNIGTEAEKGNQLTKRAHELMTSQQAYRFEGNIEARDVPTGSADVVVADGFDGNIILKYTEGLASALVGMLKEEIKKGFWSKIGALLMKPALRAFKGRMDYEAYGGAPLLGVKGVMVKAHGSSNEKAFMNALLQAQKMVDGDIVGKISRDIERLSTKKAPEEE